MIVKDSHWNKIMEERTRLLEVLRSAKGFEHAVFWDHGDQQDKRHVLLAKMKACADIEPEAKDQE